MESHADGAGAHAGVMQANQEPRNRPVHLSGAEADTDAVPDSGVPVRLGPEPTCAEAAQHCASLRANTTAAYLARRMTTTALRNWGLARLQDVACLCVSELTTNAVSHPRKPLYLMSYDNGKVPCVRVRLTLCRGSHLVVGVDDGDPEMCPEFPSLTADFGGLASHGRGLALVRHLAADFGFAQSEDFKTSSACSARDGKTRLWR